MTQALDGSAALDIGEEEEEGGTGKVNGGEGPEVDAVEEPVESSAVLEDENVLRRKEEEDYDDDDPRSTAEVAGFAALMLP